MKQTAENLLLEVKELQYESAQKINKMMPLEKPELKAEKEAKGRLYLLTAKLLDDLYQTNGQNIRKILEEGATKGITLYHCDMAENIHRIMPPP